MVLRRFLKDRRGNVAPMFALAVLPIIGLTGAAVDYSRANSTKVSLQAALVLDNTGSMADDGKIAALKTATNSLLSQLKAAASTNADVYVSIVPFVKDVNVGASNYKANWIDWTDFDANNGSCSGAYASGYNTQSACNNAGGKWTRAKHSTWNGCVTDRGNAGAPSSSNYDTNVVAPVKSDTATE